MPKISIIIPVYNRENYLKQCLDSVVNQTFKDIEILCIDDGSVDNSLNILKDYASKDDRFVIIESEHLGIGRVRNLALDKASGDYIIFVDSDDWIELNMCELMYKTITSKQLDMVLCSSWHQNFETGKFFKNSLIPKYAPGHILPNQVYTFRIFTTFFIGNMTPAAKMLSRKFLKKHQIYFGNFNWGEDQIFAIKSFFYAKACYIDDALYYWRRCHSERSLDLVSHPPIKEIYYEINKLYRSSDKKDINVQKFFNQVFIFWASAVPRFGYYRLPVQERESFLKECKQFMTKIEYEAFIKSLNDYSKEIKFLGFPLLKIIKSYTALKYKLFNKITLYKKEKFLSSRAYYILGFMFFKKKIKPNRKTAYLLGIKIEDKKINLIPKILPYAKGKDFIYYCFHTGDFYYLAQIIKANLDKFKNTVIITNFEELKQVLYLFDFSEDWIKEHFVAVPNLFYFSYALHCKKDGSIISQMELDHEKGWIVNGKPQKERGEYYPLNKVIQNFMGINKTAAPQTSKIIQKENTVLLLPESQFNGNMDEEKTKHLIENLTDLGYKVAINTNSYRYDDILNKNVYKIFLPYKETFEFANKCKAIIGVRSGLYDCLQKTATGGVKCFVIYQNTKYLHYKFFKKFNEWFLKVYSFNRIQSCNLFYEYDKDYSKLINDIKNLKKDN